MLDLVEKAEDVLDMVRRLGAEAAEVFVIDAPADAVLFTPAGAAGGTGSEAGRDGGAGGGACGPARAGLQTAVTVPHRGLGLTALWGRNGNRPGGRVGFASTTDLSPSGLAEVVEASRSAAVPEDFAPVFTPPDREDGEAARGGFGKVPGLVDRRLLEMELTDLVAVGREIVAETSEAGVRVLGMTCLSRCRRVAVANSLGLTRSSLDTAVTASVYAGTARGGFGARWRTFRSLEGLRADRLGEKAAQAAAGAEGARPVVPGRQTVVLRPEAVLSLLANSLGPALGADRAAEGASPLVRPARAVSSSILSFTDDATRPGLAGSYDFDAEGTSGRATPVIREGRLVSLLHSNRTAAAAAAAAVARRRSGDADGFAVPASTGNASRDQSERMRTFVEPAGEFGHRPRVSPSVLVVEAPGATYPDAAAAGVDRGLLVTDVMGAFVIDPAVGDFSVTAAGAWALEGGRPAYPVGRAMLAGNVYEILCQVGALIGEPEEVRGSFSVLSPSWVVDGVAVV